jgi:flagellar motor component MotA
MDEIDFMKEYNAIFERSLLFSIVSRSMGLVSLKNLLDIKKYNQKDIFEFGMRLVMDGRIPELIDKILTNIINLETDKERKLLKNIQKDAVLSIQQGMSSEELMWILNSYVNIELDKAAEKYNDMHEYISKGLFNETGKKQDEYIERYTHLAEKLVNEFYKKKSYTAGFPLS